MACYFFFNYGYFYVTTDVIDVFHSFLGLWSHVTYRDTIWFCRLTKQFINIPVQEPSGNKASTRQPCSIFQD